MKVLAADLGTTVSCIYNYEAGISYPPVKELRRICILLRVSADYLLCLTEKPREQTEEEPLYTEEEG